MFFYSIGRIIAHFAGVVKGFGEFFEGGRVFFRRESWIFEFFKLQFIGGFAQPEDNTHLNARVLPHPLRGSPLPEGASYLAPRKSVTR